MRHALCECRQVDDLANRLQLSRVEQQVRQCKLVNRVAAFIERLDCSENPPAGIAGELFGLQVCRAVVRGAVQQDCAERCLLRLQAAWQAFLENSGVPLKCCR